MNKITLENGNVVGMEINFNQFFKDTGIEVTIAQNMIRKQFPIWIANESEAIEVDGKTKSRLMRVTCTNQSEVQEWIDRVHPELTDYIKLGEYVPTSTKTTAEDKAKLELLKGYTPEQIAKALANLN